MIDLNNWVKYTRNRELIKYSDFQIRKAKQIILYTKINYIYLYSSSI
jgi:hypothetical protein